MKININQNDGSNPLHGKITLRGENTLREEHKNKENRSFGTKNIGRTDNKSNKRYGFGEFSPFTLKNSLIITPHYEVEFELTGGIRYVKNHRNDVLAVGDRISVIMNGVKKIPILLKREIDKRSEDKKIIVAEMYNFDDVYRFHHDVSLFYDEYKIESVLRCVKNNGPKPVGSDKNIISSMSLGYSIPEVRDIIRLEHAGNTTAFPSSGSISAQPCDSISFDLGGASVSADFDHTAEVSYTGKFFSMEFTDDVPLKFSFVFS